MPNIDLGIPGLSDFEEIGSGGFATVYRAYQADAARYVAVKVLAAVDGTERRRFDRERRTMGMTTAHDNVVTLFWSGYTGVADRPYLVMEYMAGGSLQDQLDNGVRLPPSEAARVVRAAAEGLAFAHASGVIHRDVKPANILMSASGVAKIGDFGIASFRESTGTGQLIFSLGYAPPETFHSTKNANGEILDQRNERSDQYSLAATLYALVTGAPPFTSGSSAAAIGRILSAPVPLVGDGPADAFFAVALAKDPADRFAHMRDVITALDEIAHPNVRPSTSPPATKIGSSRLSPNALRQSSTVQLDVGARGALHARSSGRRKDGRIELWLGATVVCLAIVAVVSQVATTL